MTSIICNWFGGQLDQLDSFVASLMGLIFSGLWEIMKRIRFKEMTHFDFLWIIRELEEDKVWGADTIVKKWTRSKFERIHLYFIGLNLVSDCFLGFLPSHIKI